MTRKRKTQYRKLKKQKDLKEAQTLKKDKLGKLQGATSNVGTGMSGKGTFKSKGLLSDGQNQ